MTNIAVDKLRSLGRLPNSTPAHRELFEALADSFEAKDGLVNALKEKITAQEARIAELTKDAERYRWLRNQHDIHDPLARVVWWNQPTGMLTFTWIETVNSKNLDESIDAAKEQV